MVEFSLEEHPPKNFDHFCGSEDFLLDRVMNSNRISNIPFSHEQKSGILSDLGIDLGRCDVYTFYNYIDIRYSEAQSRILTKRLFRRGPDVGPFSPEEMSHFDGTEDEIRSYSDEKKESIIRSIFSSLWAKSLTLHSDWLKETEGYGQTIFSSWLYDYGYVNSRRFNQICKAIKTGVRVVANLWRICRKGS